MGPFSLTLFGRGMAQLGRFADADLTEGRIDRVYDYRVRAQSSTYF